MSNKHYRDPIIEVVDGATIALGLVINGGAIYLEAYIF
jgi:hypothetical protein